MANEACKSAKTESCRSWWQVRTTTLLLMTAIFAVALGWWNDRQQINKELSSYASDNGRLESALKERTRHEKSLNQQLTQEQNIRELVRLLDPSQEDHQAAIQVLIRLNSPHDSYLKRMSLPTTSGKQLEIVVAHSSVLAIPGREDSVVLLLERTTEELLGGLVSDELRLVDCLVRQTKSRLHGGEHHYVSYADRDGAKLPEVIFEFRSKTQK